MRAILLFLLGVGSVAAEPSKTSMLDEFRAQVDPSLDKTKAKLSCKGAWKQSTGRTPGGMSYTVDTCPDANQQVMVSAGKVFAVGIALADRTTSRRADVALKDARSEMLAATCKELRKPGQLGLYDCPGSFTVVLLSNWNSKDDTNTVSAMFGDSVTLHKMIGVK